MDRRAVERASVPMEIFAPDGSPTGRQCRIMHPVDCPESRVHNVVGLASAYDTPHGRRQLRAAVMCAREALTDILDTPASEGFDPVRAVLNLNDRIFELCLHNHHGRIVLQRAGIDPFDAVSVNPRLGVLLASTAKRLLIRQHASVTSGRLTTVFYTYRWRCMRGNQRRILST